MDETATWHLRSIDHAPAFVSIEPLDNACHCRRLPGNYLFPVAQRLGPERVAAIFGRKIHGPSSLAVGPARPGTAGATPQFSARLAGSYERSEWKQKLHDRLAFHPHDDRIVSLGLHHTIGTGIGLWIMQLGSSRYPRIFRPGPNVTGFGAVGTILPSAENHAGRQSVSSAGQRLVCAGAGPGSRLEIRPGARR
jgi:hypothetical protein